MHDKIPQRPKSTFPWVIKIVPLDFRLRVPSKIAYSIRFMYSDLQFFLKVNHVELSPKYAGTLMGITNTAANMAGFAAPQLTGVVIHENVRYNLLTFQNVF